MTVRLFRYMSRKYLILIPAILLEETEEALSYDNISRHILPSSATQIRPNHLSLEPLIPPCQLTISKTSDLITVFVVSA